MNGRVVAVQVAVGDVVTISDGTTTRTIALTADDVAVLQYTGYFHRQLAALVVAVVG